MADLVQQRRRTEAWLPAMVIQGLIISVLIVAYYLPVLHRLVYKWSTEDDWSHGFIIPFFGLYYLYLQRDRIPLDLPVRRTASVLVGGLIVLIGFWMYYQGVVDRMGYPQAVSLVVSIAGVVTMCCGWPLARWSWFAVAFLLFAVPVPENLYEQMTMPLRQVAANISSAVLMLVPGMETHAAGTVVDWSYQGRSGTLDVERACSGMRLLVTMSALGVAMAFVHERPLWQRFIMILSCVPIAIFCNMIRVTLTGVMVVFDRGDLSKGTPHTMLGMGMLALAFGLYAAIGYVLSHLVVEGEEVDEVGDDIT